MAPLTPRSRSSIAAASLLLAVGCSGSDRPSGVDGGGGIACADTRCTAGQVCCIDCDGRGTCLAPGSGARCGSDTCPPARDAGPAPDAGGAGPTCGSRTCASDEVCLARVSCPKGAPPEPECIAMPSSCGDAPSCGCFATDVCGACAACGGVEDRVVQCDCACRCAAPDTPIATPDGERAIATLAPGDRVLSMHNGRLVAVPLVTVGRSPVPGDHAVVRVQLASGRVLEMSPGHPTADGRRFGDLAAGEDLGGVAVAAVELVPYERAFTHDILPASDTGTYIAAGALVGSTLANRR